MGATWTDSTWNRTTLFLWLFTILFIGLTPVVTKGFQQEQYRRCRDINGNRGDYDVSRSILPVASSLQGFYDSRCEICDNQATRTEKTPLNEKANATRTVLLVTSATPSFEKALIVTAGLLTNKSYVTIILGPHMPDPSLIRQILFQHIPCDHYFVTNVFLDFIQLNVDSRKMSCPNIMADPLTQSPGDFLLCNVQNTEILVNALSDVLHRVLRPSVLMIDASCIAGMVASEKWNIPAIVLVEHSEIFLRYIFGPPASFTKLSADDTTQSTFLKIAKFVSNRLDPRALYDSISWALQDRLHSLDLTSTFIALNRVRSRLKMKRLLHVADIWKTGGNVLLANNHATIVSRDNPTTTSGYYGYNFISVESLPQSRWSHVLQNLYTIPDPLLPPCIACTNAPVTTRPQNRSKSTVVGLSRKNTLITTDRQPPPVIVLSIAFRNDENGRSSSRRLIMAFWLALQSIKKLSQFPCTAEEELASKSMCWHGPSEFQVVRPGMGPEMLPPGSYYDEVTETFPFISAEETTYIDTLARHKPIAMVSACDHANTWTQSLGPPVLCIDTDRWSARKIAAAIVGLLRNSKFGKKSLLDIHASISTNISDRLLESRTKSAVVGVDSLEWIMTIIKRLAALHQHRKNDWEGGRPMSRDVQTVLEDLSLNRPETIHPIDLNKQHETFSTLLFLYLAWAILISFLLYVPLKYCLSNLPIVWLGNRCQFNSVYVFFGWSQLTGKRGRNDMDPPDHSLNLCHPRDAMVQESYSCFADFELAWLVWDCWVRNILGGEYYYHADSHLATRDDNHRFDSLLHPSKSEDSMTNYSTTNGINRKRRSTKKKN